MEQKDTGSIVGRDITNANNDLVPLLKSESNTREPLHLMHDRPSLEQ